MPNFLKEKNLSTNAIKYTWVSWYYITVFVSEVNVTLRDIVYKLLHWRLSTVETLIER